MDTITYKVAVCDISTNSVYIVDVPCPHYDVDEVDAFDIANYNVDAVEKYIKEEMGLDLNYCEYTIFSDGEKVEVYGNEDELIATIE